MLDVVRTEPTGHYTTASTGITEIKRQLDDWVYDKTGGLVQSGPFAGMKLMRETAWKEAYLTPMLLGCYEEELHGELERQISRLRRLTKQPKIAVVGAAEGYYAVGLKLRVPQSEVFVLEPDAVANNICGQAAIANGVSLIGGAPLSAVMDAPDLIFMDCEGHEVAYCDPERWPHLRGVNLIVEVHNFPGQDTNEILLDRFRGSHSITMLMEGSRNPNRYEVLIRMVSDYRWLAVSEGRPCWMGWYVMEPKGTYCP